MAAPPVNIKLVRGVCRCVGVGPALHVMVKPGAAEDRAAELANTEKEPAWLLAQ